LAMRSVPPSLRIVGGNEGLPVLPDLEIGILRNPLSTTQAVERLNDFLRRDLAQQA
ncbi:transcriptional regulator, partial [Mesorhizobium sp. M7A.F.Ca.CA.004.06.1.1]